MLFRLIPAIFLAMLAGVALAAPSPAESQAPPGAPPPVPTGEEVLARGPVHEAYAEPTVTTSPPALVVVKEPPQPIDEMPPDQKPAGDNVVWISGYWNWDDETKDYIWLSGFWRAEPPGRAWTPGHWQRVVDGWQWVSGFWAAPNLVETEYLPPPPATVNVVPPPVPTTMDAATATYIPGIWIYQVNRYLWRPGYWIAYHAGWVWTPSFYRWTPAGYVYVPGYWDVPLLERGLLFAPVRFSVAIGPRFVFRPTFVIQPDFLLGALFVRTGLPRFYFGNYFDPRYARGYVSWINYRPGRGAIDVNFSYYHAAYARHPDWERNLKSLYAGRAAGTIARPPITWSQQTRVINNINLNKTTSISVNKQVNITHLQNVSVLQPISRVNNLRVTGMASLASNKPGFASTAPIQHQLKVERVDNTRMAEEKRAVERSRAIAKERSRAEAKVIPRAGKPGAPAASVKVKVELPKGTPPARAIHESTKAPPPAPNRPKAEKPSGR